MNNLKRIYTYCIIVIITLLGNNSFCQVINWGDSGVAASKKTVLLKKIATNKEIILYNDSGLIIKTDYINISRNKNILTDKEFDSIDSCLRLLISKGKIRNNVSSACIKMNISIDFILHLLSSGKCLVVYNGKIIRYCRIDLYIYKNGSRELRYYFNNKLFFIRPMTI